jgi:molybdate transport system substrate-binding protein
MRYTLLLLLALATPGHSADPIRVAVAANFRGTLEQINQQFQRETGHAIVLSSASTGVLYSQITHGAPFDIFFAADKDSVIKLAATAANRDTGRPFCYALGRLVLGGGNGMLDQLKDPANSLAIANPATAPYGAAAMAVLERAEFSPGTGRKLVRGANAVQAYQFWHSGAVDLALLPMVLAPGATPIPASWHPMLEQFAIALTPAGSHPALDSYLNWIRSDTVRALITDAGYEPCP